MTETVLEVKNLKKYFDQEASIVQTLLGEGPDPVEAVDDVTFDLSKQQSVGVIGESGCGKTTLLRTLMGLYDPTDGDIRLNGQSLSDFEKEGWLNYRKNVQIIFQDPFNALDPKMSIRASLKEPLKIHDMGDQERRVREVLEKVELNPPESFLNKRPSKLSGGELQRVSIARALVLEPDVILADEPVSMLDVSTQAAILNLLSDLMEDVGASMVYISHDLSTVSYVCDTINVMYLGRVVENAPTDELLDNPKHPYTQALVQAIPYPDPHANRQRTEMEGAPRDPIGLGEGCRFRDRCPERMDICEKTPRSVQVEDGEGGHQAACHLYYQHEGVTRDQEATAKEMSSSKTESN
jgi:peptide/nickel transport system ATP-binding protein